MTSITEQLSHRLQQLEQFDDELIIQTSEKDDELSSMEQRFNQELRSLKQECTMLREQCDKLHKMIFSLGHVLKDKLTHQELDELQAKVDAWNVEQFIQQKELPKMFDRYANQ